MNSKIPQTINLNLNNTIIACCTPSGAGAIALIRISGPEALTVAALMAQLPRAADLQQVPSHTVHFGYVQYQDGTVIDQVMWIVMHGPSTFTGFNTVEITCHNNPLIIQRIIDRACQLGARLAGRGEFCAQAIANGKMDLLKAESIHELVTATSQASLKQQLCHIRGSLSHLIAEIEQELLTALALCNASFEFIEEENITFDQQIRAILSTLHNQIKKLLAEQPQQKHIEQGFRIALVGAVNAGKSSLFNKLLGQQRAIVTDIAGTTRDSIEAQLYTPNYRLTLIDTAGIRTTEDVVEKYGVERSWQEAELADVVIIVLDSSRELSAQEAQTYKKLQHDFAAKSIIVANKCDIASNQCADNIIVISCATGQGTEQLMSAIEHKLADLIQSLQVPHLLNRRQFQLLSDLLKDIAVMIAMTQSHIDYELLAVHLEQAISRLAELTGKTVTEDAMNKVFQQFCVGK